MILKGIPQILIEVGAEKRNSNWVIRMKNVAHLRQNRDPYPIIFSPCPACLVRWFHQIFNKTDQLGNDGVKICIECCPAQLWPVAYLCSKNIWILGILAKKSCWMTSKSFKHHYVSSFDFRALKRMEQVCSHTYSSSHENDDDGDDEEDFEKYDELWNVVAWREMISWPAQRWLYRPIWVSHQLLSYCLLCSCIVPVSVLGKPSRKICHLLSIRHLAPFTPSTNLRTPVFFLPDLNRPIAHLKK